MNVRRPRLTRFRGPLASAIALAGAFFVFASTLGGCASTSESDRETDEESSALIDGFDVLDPRADSVGTLGRIFGPDTFDATCTGALIARDQVLTAKHCVQSSTVEAPYVIDREIGFAVGFDSSRPRKIVKAKSVRTYDPKEGGYIGFGRDVAIYTLEEPIDDVPPLRITAKPLSNDDVGRRFWAVGYGAQDYEHRTRGTRRAGAVSLRAIAGKPMHALFTDRDSFLEFLKASEGSEWVASKRSVLDAFFDYELLPNLEIYVGLREAQPCDGDSGGPLVRQLSRDDFEIVGVVSGSRKGAKNRCSVLGEFYANVDRASLEL